MDASTKELTNYLATIAKEYPTRIVISNPRTVKYCAKVHQRTIGLQCKSAPPVEVVNL